MFNRFKLSGVASSGVPVSAVDAARSTGVFQDIQSIDRLLARGFALLKLPDPLEAGFMQSSARRRIRLLLISAMLVAFIHNSLLVSDAVMIPDQFELALTLRLYLFTPLSLLALFLVRNVTSSLVLEALIVVSSLFAVAINAYLCMASSHPNAGPYLVNMVSVVVFSNTVARIRFKWAVMLDVIVLALFVWAASQIPSAPREVMWPAGVMMLSLSVFTLYGCFMLELDERRNWLIRWRERLLREELVQANARLDVASRHDQLTGLPNRHHFEDVLTQAWTQAQHRGVTLSLALLDVDHLRSFNTAHGQAAGDACLRQVASILRAQASGDGDLVARYGGEEFVVLKLGARIEEVAAMAERVQAEVMAGPCHVTVSVGVASIRPDAPHAHQAQLIAAVDEALRQAKHQGGNRVFAFGTHE